MEQSFDRNLLAVARRMPGAKGLLDHIKVLREIFTIRLDLDLDADAFDAVMVGRFGRCAEGFSADPILIAAAIEASARPKMNLTHEQRQTLRNDIAAVNEDINRKAREIVHPTPAKEGEGA